MKLLKTTIKYRVPSHHYCNHTLSKSTIDTRCRFCTEISKGRFVCVLQNEPLVVEQGYLIQKCKRCLDAHHLLATTVDDTPQVSPAKLMKYAIVEYRRQYKALLASGYPDVIADKAAMEGVLNTGGNQ